MSSPFRVEIGAVPDELEDFHHQPEASFFQSPGWLASLCRADPRFEAGCITARDASGDLCAAFPFVRVQRVGLQRLYASAAGTYGGILARDAAAGRAVLQQLEKLAASPRLLRVRVHDFSGSFEAHGAGPGWRRVPETCQVLELPKDAETLFHDAFTSQNRNKIRKAQRAGLSVRRAHDTAALETYAALYDESAQRWGVAAVGSRRLLVELVGIPGVDVWLADHNGAPVAGLLNLRWGGQVMNWGNVSRQSAWKYAPNNLLHWCAIEAACRDTSGPRLYNFGGSAGLPNVHTFKRSFGATERRYFRYDAGSRVLAWAKRFSR